MSKLVIVLCAVILASAVTEEDLENVLYLLQQGVNDTISKLILKLETTKTEINKEVGKITERMYTFSNRTWKNMMEIKKNVSVEMANVAKDINTFKCIELSNDLLHITKIVTVNMSVCVTDKLKTKRKQINIINIVSLEMLRKFNQMREELLRCVDNVASWQSVDDVISCAREAANKATNVSNKVFKRWTKELTNLDKLSRIHTLLADCSEMSGYDTLYQKSEETKHCISTLTRVAEKQSPN